MKLEIKTLTQKLNFLKSGINENDFSRIGKYLFFFPKYICSFDGRFMFLFEFETEFEESFAIPFTEFYKTVENIHSHKEVRTEIDKDVFLLKTKNIKASFPINREVIKTLLPELKILKSKYTKLPKNFIEGLNHIQFTVNKNSTPMDGSAYIYTIGNKLFSTDRYRIGMFVLSEEMEEVLIPFDCVDHLKKIEVDEYYIDKTYTLFKKNDFCILIINSEVQKMKFDKFESIYSSKKSTLSVDLPMEEMKEALGLTEIFTDQKNIFQKMVDFLFVENELICTSQNECGKLEYVVNLGDKNTLSGTFKIHPLFLVDILSMNCKMEIIDEIALFRGKDFLYFFKIGKK